MPAVYISQALIYTPEVKINVLDSFPNKIEFDCRGKHDTAFLADQTGSLKASSCRINLHNSTDCSRTCPRMAH